MNLDRKTHRDLIAMAALDDHMDALKAANDAMKAALKSMDRKQIIAASRRLQTAMDAAERALDEVDA
jgi:hypothetical protein